MGKRRKQADHRANLRGGRFVGLPTVVLESAAYLYLDAFDRAVLVEIMRKFDGYNNGRIAISQRELAERLRNTNFRRIGRAIGKLVEHGLVAIDLEGSWEERRAREYRLTFVSSGTAPHGRPSTDEYRWWEPAVKSRADDVSATGPDVAATSPAALLPAADDVTAKIRFHQRKTAISA